MAHANELSAFNAEWDKRMDTFDAAAEAETSNLESKHQAETEELAAMDVKLGAHPKSSASILNLKKIQDNLAHMQSYKEAADIQFQLKGLETLEDERWATEKQQRLTFLQTAMEKRQGLEMRALKKKLETKRHTIEKERAKELDKLACRYQNVKRSLELKYAVEVSKVQKRPTTGSTICLRNAKTGQLRHFATCRPMTARGKGAKAL